MNRLATLTICSALTGLLLVTASCTKTSNGLVSNTTTTTTTDILTSSIVGTHWQMADFKLDKPMDFNGDGKLDTELTQFMNPCDLDNTVTFERNGTVAIKTGKVQCDGKQGFTSPKLSNWSYDKSTNVLRLVNESTKNMSEWQVIEASTKFLKVKMALGADGQSATVTWKNV